MMKRITTLAAVLVTGAIAASPALGDDHARDAHARAAAGQTGAPIKDPFPYRETPGIQPGPPTWPAHPQPLTRPAPAVPAEDGGSDASVWLLVGGGLVAAGIAGSAAGMARRQRVRARRVAV
jgi:hypothetical protein